MLSTKETENVLHCPGVSEKASALNFHASAPPRLPEVLRTKAVLQLR